MIKKTTQIILLLFFIFSGKVSLAAEEPVKADQKSIIIKLKEYFKTVKSEAKTRVRENKYKIKEMKYKQSEFRQTQKELMRQNRQKMRDLKSQNR